MTFVFEETWKSNLQQSQSGATLILLLFIIALAAATYSLKIFDASDLKAERDKKTGFALAEAKASLIGWSIGQASKPGSLPCTDTINGGSGVTSGTNACASYLGRLPWKQLGLQDIRDGNGECLWYAVSPDFRNNMTDATRVTKPLVTTSGAITIKDNFGTILATNVVAVVMAPGATLAGQDGSDSSATTCGGNLTVSNYLENYDATNLVFISSPATSTFNDRLIYITKDEIYVPLRKRIIKEMVGNIAVTSGLLRYYQTYSSYPCASNTLNGSQNCGVAGAKFIPYSDPNLQYAQLGTWMLNNGWFSGASYGFDSAFPTKFNLGLVMSGTSTCNGVAGVITCVLQ